MEVVVEYDYEALHEDELTLRKGDLIKNVCCIQEDGWMEGDLNGKRGLFPDNFVKEVKQEDKEARSEPKEESAQPLKREKSVGNVANLVQRMSTIGIPTGGFQPRPSTITKKAKKRQVKVFFEYQPQNEDELELKVGDIVDVVDEVEEGWWSGIINGKSGLFPSNFVKEVDTTKEDGDSNDTTPDEADGHGVENTTPSSPTPTSGNGAIVQPKKIPRIGFGDIFKEGSIKSKVRIPNLDTEEKKENPIPALPSAAKPAFSNMTEMQKGDGDSNSKELCKVTFAFVATNDDELTLHEDDIITIISKDTGEPGWWRGEVGGKEGVFPDNFVEMISDTEKEVFISRGSRKTSQKQDPEEKLTKPPPPSKDSKHIALKPEVPSADKKPHATRPDDKVDSKPTKPGAPVPPKKPAQLPGKGKQGSLPPKRPDKPLTPSPNLRHNGEVHASRPKPDLDHVLPPKPKTPSAETGDKSMEPSLISFDEVSSSPEKLSHPTANRPKITGRRLPAQFAGGQSKPPLQPNKDSLVEKSFKMDEEDGAKLKPVELRKPSTHNLSPSPSFHKPSDEAKPSPAVPNSNSDSSSLGTDDPKSQMEELRNQMKDLLLSVELFKAQQMKEITELRGELDEERLKRVALQMELDKLKMAVQST
ncbi:CD2-associated protein isoform X1 [Corythoichthys intestinalis]|uniref:CD2-associated protein isoform X1 n=1 Tax=Corythoichthys intestinalis TaxID=161448 RepID=UPI0025A59CCB|nr:CD2-associated protein isoform X1 [Corythoichthys intestinalis]